MMTKIMGNHESSKLKQCISDEKGNNIIEQNSAGLDHSKILAVAETEDRNKTTACKRNMSQGSNEVKTVVVSKTDTQPLLYIRAENLTAYKSNDLAKNLERNKTKDFTAKAGQIKDESSSIEVVQYNDSRNMPLSVEDQLETKTRPVDDSSASGEGVIRETRNNHAVGQSPENQTEAVVKNGISVKQLNDSLEEMDSVTHIERLVDALGQDDKEWGSVMSQISALMRRNNAIEVQDKIISVLITKDFANLLEIYVKKNDESLFSLLENLNKQQTIGRWSVIKSILVIIWIACDQNVNFCQYMLTSKVFDFLLTELQAIVTSLASYDTSQNVVFVVKAMLGIFHNIVRHVQNCKWTFRNKGAIAVLRHFLSSKVPMIRVKSLIVLSYLLSETENDIIASDDDNFSFIYTVLSDAMISIDHKSSKYGMTTKEILCGVGNLAINDENKIRIVKNGFLTLYEEVLKSGTMDERKQAVLTLWSLAFHHFNKQKMRAMPGIMNSVFELQQCSDQELCHAARGTYWELENVSKTAICGSISSSVSDDQTNGKPHIMISYQWDSQAVLVEVKNKLRAAGFKVWMDVEHMTGSTLEAMALAVEKAAVILICMSQKYKDSPNCRTEAEYVYRLRKDFIPLRVQKEYVPDGWLGILVGTRLYFDILSIQMVDIQLPRIVKELRNRGKMYTSTDSTDSANITSAPPAPQRLVSRECVPHDPVLAMPAVCWSPEQVQEWYQSVGVPEKLECLTGLDGALLEELYLMQASAPEYFYNFLQAHLPPLSVLKFSRSLRILFKPS